MAKVEVEFKDLSNPWKVKYRKKVIETQIPTDECGFVIHDALEKKLDTILKVELKTEKIILTGYRIRNPYIDEQIAKHTNRYYN